MATAGWTCAMALLACSSPQTNPPNSSQTDGAAGAPVGSATPDTGAPIRDGSGDAPSSSGGAASADAAAAGGTGGNDPRSDSGTTGGESGAAGAGATLGAATFGEDELDPASNGGTLTFQNIGAQGWYPSRRDPQSGQCDAYRNGSCCMTEHALTDERLTPWNEELILTLRGPIVVKQLVVYQPGPASGVHWDVVAAWDERSPSSPQAIAFSGNRTEQSGFSGIVGSECLVDVSSDRPYPCGANSVPYCEPPAAGQNRYHGWEGSKLFVLLASMPHANSASIEAAAHCSESTTGNWYDAPWIGLSHGELVRSGKFGECHCYAKDPAQWYLGDGCGQFNVFEVVNDNNEYKNLDVFSTNFFGYAGYVGEGPCGAGCDVSEVAAAVDLIDKSSNREAAAGSVATPERGPGAAFRRPSAGYRYFLILLDMDSRTVQLAILHPRNIPAEVAMLLPELPRQLPGATVDSVRGLRLPR